MFSRNDFSVWSILKQCIGKELSKITMPVIFNEPLSFVQRVVEYMEYAPLIQKACESRDPVERLEYVTAFAVSAAASNWERLGKPFNPLLGETYELEREDLGFKIACEQVSHHPPVSAFHVTSDQYTFHGAIHPKLKFWGRSVEVTPKGTVTLTLTKWGETYTWTNVNCCIHNIIVGKLWIEHYGVMEITNHKTRHKTVLNFKPSGWTGKDLHRLEGYIYDENKKKVRALYGKWVEALYSYDMKTWEMFTAQKGRKDIDIQPEANTDPDAVPEEVPVKGSSCDLALSQQRLLWTAEPRPVDSQKYYSFTLFALMLNELHEEDRAKLPPTDSRLRPDIRKLEEGDLDGAAEFKHEMEEKQRTARKVRKDSKQTWSPKWFRLDTNPHTGKEDWIFNPDYWKRKWDRCPDIF